MKEANSSKDSNPNGHREITIQIWWTGRLTSAGRVNKMDFRNIEPSGIEGRGGPFTDDAVYGVNAHDSSSMIPSSSAPDGQRRKYQG